MHRRSIFIFRQDLRVEDNTGLRHAIQESKEVVPVFILDTTIISSFPLQDARLGFLLDALQQLEKALQQKQSGLYVYLGNPIELLPELLKRHKCAAVYYNRSYGSNSLTRDHTLQKRCKEHAVSHKDFPDFLLVEPQTIPARKVFTPFYNLRKAVPKRLHSLHIDRIASPAIPPVDRNSIHKKLSYSHSSRSVSNSHTLLTSFEVASYESTRNIPSLHYGTSKLSPYTRFGLLSIRQILRHVLEKVASQSEREAQGILFDNATGTVTLDKKQFSNTFVSELARREFWHHIALQFPESRYLEFQHKRRGIKRVNNEQRFAARQEGKTGYPIVDAGMRQLKTENRMHNRVRMIVASFLTKDLLIDRRRGEQHFAHYLLDYDENVNIGNRQRAASVGADPKPLRIFNPILQSQRFDPHAEYILKRIPELRGQPLKAIHDPLTHSLSYHPPIINHYITSKQAKKLYSKT